MKVEIVIPVINLWAKYTRQCIDSVMNAMMRAKGHEIDCHIILIDNASSDETAAEATKMESELFHYHRNFERWGFQKSVNYGVAYGMERGADLFLICNNDILLHPESIWRLVERFKGDEGIVSCMDVRGEMSDTGLLPVLIGNLIAKEKEKVDEAPHPNFSAFMVSKACWETVGEFDELFFPAYFEDNDYHYRMKLLGIPAIVYPPAMFYHYGSRTQNEASESGVPMVGGQLFENNRAFYIQKWGGLPNEEKFEHPYNDESKEIKSTKQISTSA